jgi:hypothetical protein
LNAVPQLRTKRRQKSGTNEFHLWSDFPFHSGDPDLQAVEAILPPERLSRDFSHVSTDRDLPVSSSIVAVRGSSIAKTKLSVRKAEERQRKEGQEGKKEAP